MRKRNRGSLIVTVAVALAAIAVGCAGGNGVKDRVTVEVTDQGFVPKEIPAKVGQPITLVVTRKTELTCAKQIVFADLGVEKELPMNQAVEVTVTPERQGDLRFACDMDMVAGRLVVEP